MRASGSCFWAQPRSCHWPPQVDGHAARELIAARGQHSEGGLGQSRRVAVSPPAPTAARSGAMSPSHQRSLCDALPSSNPCAPACASGSERGSGRRVARARRCGSTRGRGARQRRSLWRRAGMVRGLAAQWLGTARRRDANKEPPCSPPCAMSSGLRRSASFFFLMHLVLLGAALRGAPSAVDTIAAFQKQTPVTMIANTTAFGTPRFFVVVARRPLPRCLPARRARPRARMCVQTRRAR